ncbi:MAG: gluconokinase [Pseudomonadota bacterium]
MAKKFVIMGVAGCGKTSVGEALGAKFGWHYEDGDTLHPQHNIDKMERGIPLTDADRHPWLLLVGETLCTHTGSIAIGCSALKRSYRDTIRQAAKTDVCFIHLAGTRELIESRMAARQGHFMPVSLLDSQFAALEPPNADENAITVDISGDLESVIAIITRSLEEQVLT